MPEFELDGKLFQNPVELALHVIGGKWKMPILWRLRDQVWRYNELRRDLKNVSHKMLTQELRDLERSGLVTRTVHPVIPPHVDYAITELGASAMPAIETLRSWGAHYRRHCEHHPTPGDELSSVPGADALQPDPDPTA